MRPSHSRQISNWIQKFKIGIILGLLPLLFVVAQFFTHSIFTDKALANTTPQPAIAYTQTAIALTTQPHSGDLQLGDRSQAVRDLKAQLQNIGYGNNAPPSRRFDRATEENIRKFQSDQGLPVNGIADAQTRTRLEIALSQTAIANNTAIEPTTAITVSTSAATEARTAVEAIAHRSDLLISEAPPTSPKIAAVETRATESTATETTAPKHFPPDIQTILDRGKLVVSLLNRDNPPFFMLDKNGQLDGSDVRTAKAIAKALDVDIEFRRSATTFNEVVQDVYQHNADLAVSKISRTLNRAKQNRFSKPYLNLRQGLLINRLQLAQDSHGEDMTEMVRHLKGKIGVIKDSSYARFAKQNFPQATVVDYPDWNAVIQAITQGEILAAYRDELEVKKIVLTQPDAALKLQTISLTDTKDSLAVVLPWESEHLLAFVNQYLETAQDNGDIIDTTDDLLEAYSDYFEPS